MRIAFLGVLFFASACVARALDGDPAAVSSDGGVVDLAIAVPDGNVAIDMARAVDMAEAGLSCIGIIDCLNTCGDEDCFDACYGKGSIAGRADFDAVSTCASNACNAPCTQSSDACNQCSEDVVAAPGTCGMRPACGACFVELKACGF